MVGDVQDQGQISEKARRGRREDEETTVRRLGEKECESGFGSLPDWHGIQWAMTTRATTKIQQAMLDES